MDSINVTRMAAGVVLTHDVVEREPQDPGVVRLKRAVDVHNLAELRIAGSTGIDAEGRIVVNMMST